MAHDFKIDMNKLRNLLEEIAKKGDPSLREICRKAGFSETYLTKVKRGDFKEISFTNLGKFCHVMGLDHFDFIQGGRVINLDTLDPELASDILELVLKHVARN